MDFTNLSRANAGNCSKSIENIVSGSPLVEWLELRGVMSNHIAIVSKSLKVLSFDDFQVESIVSNKISCPNLVELNVNDGQFPSQMIENALSVSSFFRSLKLTRCVGFGNLVIASKSLKVLHLDDIQTAVIEVSCPNLEKLDFVWYSENNFNAVNLPASICATLDCTCKWVSELYLPVKGLLEQFQHVNNLTIEKSFFKVVSDFDAKVLQSLPELNNNCLTLNVDYNFGLGLPGIAYALRSPMLETLVINLKSMFHWFYVQGISEKNIQNLIISRLDDWNSNGSTGFTCLESHLKTVKVIGLYERDDKCKHVLEFIEFVLKNARVLEKMIALLKKSKPSFVIEVSQKLLSFPRHSRVANVELLCSA